MKFGKKIEKALGINFYDQPVYDENYIKTKVKEFNDVINTVFSENDIPKKYIITLAEQQ